MGCTLIFEMLSIKIGTPTLVPCIMENPNYKPLFLGNLYTEILK